MPVLASLMEKGSWGALRSTVPPVTAPAWTSFITGTNPGRHGIFQFFSLNPHSADSLGMGQKTYLAIPGIVVNSSRIRGDKLWNILDRAGVRQITVNLPMAYPPEPVNGVMVTGMLTPPGSIQFTWPPELSREMADYEIDLNPGEKDFSGDNRVFLGRVGEILEKRVNWSLKLMAGRPWDFAMVVITETDRLQHRFYDLLAPGPVDPASPERAALRPAVEDLFRRTDEALGKLVAAAGAEARLVIVSDHGFGRAPTELVDLRVLSGLLGVGPRAGARKTAARLRRGWPAITKRRVYACLGFLPGSWLERAEAAVRRRSLRRQKAILFKMHENVGGIWINLRDAGGGITDPAAHAALMTSLRAGLEKLEWQGRKVVDSVHAKEELYQGPCLDQAPDLIYILREEYGILEPEMAGPPAGLVVTVTADRPRKKGTHRLDGMFLLAGPGLKKRRAVTRARIEDMTATILHLLGLPVPGDMDGVVLEGAFEEEALAREPVRRSAAAAADAPESRAYDPEEEKAIRARLEGIGYLD